MKLFLYPFITLLCLCAVIFQVWLDVRIIKTNSIIISEINLVKDFIITAFPDQIQDYNNK